MRSSGVVKGEMRERIRGHDWGATPLGPRPAWPASLATAVELMLDSPGPVSVLWGPERIQLYNDAYAEIASDRHPEALGGPAAANWGVEGGQALGPVLERVQAGETVVFDELPASLPPFADGADARHFGGTFVPLRDEAGTVRGVFHALTDLTAAVRASAELRASEARMRGVLDGMAEAFGLLAPDFTILEHNAEALRLDGRPREEIVGRSHWDAFPDTEDSEIGRRLKRAMAERVPVSLEHLYAYEAGHARWLEMRAYPTVDGALAVFWRDVTGRKEAEGELRASEARLQAVVAQAAAGIAQTDLAGRFTSVNDRYCQLVGRPRDELLTLTMQDVTHPDDLPGNLPMFAAAAAGGPPFEIEKRYVRPDGSAVWVRNSVSAIRSPGGAVESILAVTIDLTERRMAEAAMRESEARFRNMADHAPVMSWVTDSSGFCTYLNRRWYEFTGQTRDEAEGFGWLDAIHPDDRPETERVFREANARHEPFRHEYRLRGADGRYRWAIDAASPRFDDDGEFLGYVGSVIDIDERKRAEARDAALAELADRFRNLETPADISFAAAEVLGRTLGVSRAGYGVIDKHAETITIERDWNAPGIRTLAGTLHFRDYGSYIEELKRGETVVFADAETDPRTSATAAALKAISAQAVVNMPVTEQGDFVALLYLNHADAREWTADELAFVREVADRTHNAAERRRAEAELREQNATLERRVAEEVAERSKAEDALRQAQKMEAMGQLTGGVAHDFNNLLTPIVGGLDLLQRRGVGGEREQRVIAGAIQSAERAKTLVQRLLAFARRQPLQATAVDIGRLVRNMADLVASTTGPQVHVAVEVEDDLPAAVADPNQVEMALLNLAVNARDAMPDGGTLRISAAAAEAGIEHRTGLAPGRYVCLSVADTGTGMDEATARRAVEPFFSTKGVGKGTGLGLSMVHGLASQLGGALAIQSRRGVGTNVELWLPRSDNVPHALQPPAEPPDCPVGAGLALVVDDEELVRMSTADMLLDLGYEVVSAESAEQALAMVEDGLRPAVLVTDHLMPGMNGTDLARRLRGEQPGLRVLVVSGYAESEGIAPDLPRLTKPFRKDELAAGLAGSA